MPEFTEGSLPEVSPCLQPIQFATRDEGFEPQRRKGAKEEMARSARSYFPVRGTALK